MRGFGYLKLKMDINLAKAFWEGFRPLAGIWLSKTYLHIVCNQESNTSFRPLAGIWLSKTLYVQEWLTQRNAVSVPLRGFGYLKLYYTKV